MRDQIRHKNVYIKLDEKMCMCRLLKTLYSPDRVRFFSGDADIIVVFNDKAERQNISMRHAASFVAFVH